ncbi:MAG: hypothetical protein Q4B78_05555 [Bacillota bacterium]|nr:hypothetical protein [Bacillota bacterium]
MKNINLEIIKDTNAEEENNAPTTITYNFVDGTSVELDVGAEWSKIVLDLRREEESADRLTRMYCVTADVLGDEGPWMADTNEESCNETALTLYNSLTEEQKSLVETIYDDKVTITAYAEKHGVSQSSVSQKIATIRKQLLKAGYNKK